MSRNAIDWWLSEAEEPTAAQAPTTDPAAQVVGAGQQPQPPDAGQEEPSKNGPPDNVEDDPTTPDQEEEQSSTKDFEQWKHNFYELSIKGDVNEMLSAIGQVHDRDGLEAPQRKFIKDNMLILLYRQEANVAAATKQIRNLIKEDMDRANPGTAVMQHIVAVIEKDQLLQNALIKMTGLAASKGEIHRKYIAALLGAVQVGGGGAKQDLMYFDKNYTINISTRFATQLGEINLGKWSLRTDDPDRYLTEPELDRLSNGSPEEKQTLRRRIIIESIGEKFKERAFLINVVNEDGTIMNFGWDLGDCLLSAYKDGKIVVRGKQNIEKEAMISDTGEIVSLIDYDIMFVRETGETDDDGKPEMVEVPFIERRDSILYLCANLETIQTATNSLSGIFFNELPYNGNPSDIISLADCVPDMSSYLSRKCGPQA